MYICIRSRRNYAAPVRAAAVELGGARKMFAKSEESLDFACPGSLQSYPLEKRRTQYLGKDMSRRRGWVQGFTIRQFSDPFATIILVPPPEEVIVTTNSLPVRIVAPIASVRSVT